MNLVVNLMKISAKDWQAYVNKLSSINKKAGELLSQYIDQHGFYDREALIDYANAVVSKYGEASATLACQLYDELAEIQKANVPLAEPATIANRNEVAGAIVKTRGKKQATMAVERLVKLSASDTILKNAKRDHAEWAWVSRGDTCPFCITLASQGWMPASKAIMRGNHAEHIHAHCDCEFAIRFDGKSSVEGYDPQKFKLIYDSADGKSPRDKMNAIRRANYIPKSIQKIPKLTKEEQHALNKYIGPDSYALNEALRNGKELTLEQKEWCQNLDSALDKMPKYNGTVTRSIFMSNVDAVNFVERLSEGGAVKFEQYLSTTCGDKLYDLSANVQMKILNTKKGYDLTLINKAEMEVLFKRNSEFKMLEYKKVNGKIWVILEEVV